MKKQSIFEYLDYKSYLKDSFPAKGSGRGERAKLAEFLNCRSAFISQVLNSATHFSMEHAKLLDEYLHHNPAESRFFMTLVMYGRAGSKKLEEYFSQQIQEMQEARKKVFERVQGNLISEKFQATYYSSWYYSAIHLLVLIPELRTLETLSECLRLPKKIVSEAIDFLVQIGCLEEKKGEYVATDSRIHLKPGSPLLYKHHANWRLKAIESIELGEKNNVHYSGCVAVSRANAEIVRKNFLDFIGKLEPILAEPHEEVAFGLCLDYFKIF